LCAALAVLVFSVEGHPQHLPLAFEENKKQAEPGIRFLTRTPLYQINLKRSEVEIAFKSRSVLIRFAGASEKSKPEGRGRLDELIRHVHETKSDQKRKVPTFALVRYENLYPGIDLDFYGRQSQVQYDFAIAPESDPAQIGLVFQNTDRIEIDESGDLVIAVGEELHRVRRPTAFQYTDGERRSIDVRYKLLESNQISFDLGDYDPALRLTIRYPG
jgi:hypothetical protein